jgi:hypothetical protein
MIIRNYLPYKSAREYCDRKMAKWMGFFLSEHTTALHSMTENVSVKSLSSSKLLLLISQSFLNNFTIEIFVDNNQSYVGTIYDIFDDTLYFECDNQMINIKFDDILNINLME